MGEKRAQIYVLVFAALVLCFFLPWRSSWLSGSELHTELEIVATLLAAFVGVIALVRYYARKSNVFLCVGTGFLGTALLESYHALVTSDFLARYLPSALPSLIAWSWIAARVFLSVLVWLSWLVWKREASRGDPGRIPERSVYLGTAALTLASFAFFALVPLPRAYYPELIFHRPEEFLPALFFLLALVGYLRKGDWRHDPFEHWLVLSLIVALVEQAAFMSLSGQLYDGMFDFAHLLKNISYACVLTGLLVSTFSTFRRAEEGAEENRIANEALRDEVRERERTVLALHQSEKKYRALFEGSRDAIYFSTIDGSLLDANKAFQDLLGYESDEAACINAAALYANPDHRAQFRREIDKYGSVVDFEAKYRRKDGTELDCLETATVRRGPGGETVGYQGILRDVTERKKVEEQLRQRQKVEVVGQLASGVAHDFNNLLTGITGYTQLVLEQQASDATAADDLRRVLELANRAADLTHQLLAFGRRQQLELQVINLHDLVESSCEMIESVVGEAIELQLSASADLGNVRVDPSQIEQVMMNLILNARDAMPDGGKLRIETANVMLDQDHARAHADVQVGPYVMLAISDTGIGMSEAARLRAFEPFFTTKETGAGTGLGLSMVYGIVTQHGGSVWADSVPGQGTCISLYLPRVPEEARASVGKPDREETLRGHETILLVEDQEAVRAVVERALQGRGYTVVTASRPEEAEKLREEARGEIALLLTDVIMPGYDGHELYLRLVATDPSLKVLFMSGYPGKALKSSGQVGRTLPFIQKPFSPTELARKVREILDTPSGIREGPGTHQPSAQRGE